MDGFFEADTMVVELEKREYRIRQVMDNVAECVRWEDLENHVHEGVVREFSYIVAVDEFEDRVKQYPATWWDHVKLDLAPKWFTDRFPVKYNRIVCTLEHIYPDIDVRLYDKNPTIKFHTKDEVK